ncbi:hypothetical protein [uncultured Agrobacterium sp.]|uniref:hypothetical protein n=1 Tax=uncultured Agrobacterium sp. TaxID=157277 RepID=UPI0025ED5106|nr:hypothetical protein [uncultured Agrobacterium sp.]
MNIQPEKRYRQFFFDADAVDKHWDRQVWFWKRKKIYRLRVAIADITDTRHDIVEKVLDLHSGARNALHGVGQYGYEYVTFAFPTKADAMLFKLAHGGSC